MANAFVYTLLVNSAVFAVLFALVLLLRAGLGRRLSVGLSLALWAALAVKLILPFGVESSLSPFGWFAQRPAATQAVLSPDATPLTLPAVTAQSVSVSLPLPAVTAAAAPLTLPQATAPVVRTLPTPAPTPVPWTLWALLIWASGAMGVALWLLLGQAALTRRLHAASEASPQASAVLAACRQELGIRRAVGIKVIKNCGSPAIAGLLRPTILLDEAVAGDVAALRPVLLHELSHFRYGDLWAIHAMNLLCTIYWFHPLVWVLCALVRRDMETRCDQRVLTALNHEDGLGYVHTLLRFSGFGAKERLRAALGMSSARSAMERRIRDMFRSRRADTLTRAVSLGCAVLMLCAGVLTACQPTPEKPIVQSKNNDSVRQAIEQHPPATATPATVDSTKAAETPAIDVQAYRFTAPTTWKGESKDEAKKITVQVDATVSVPTDTWGIYELIPQTQDQEYLDRVLQTLLKGAKIYGRNTYKGRVEIQKEIQSTQKQIDEIKTMMETAPQQGNASLAASVAPAGTPAAGAAPTSRRHTVTKDELAARLASQQQMLQEEEQQLANAPAKAYTENIDIDPDILFDDAKIKSLPSPDSIGDIGSLYASDGYVQIYGYADMGKPEPAQINISKIKTGLIQIDYNNAGLEPNSNEGITGKEPLGDKPLYGVSISMEDAKKLARQAVQDMGMGYLDIAATQKMELYDRSRMTDDRMPECYAFSFTRSFGNALTTYAMGGNPSDPAKAALMDQLYAKSWNISEVTVGVDDSGVMLVRINTTKSDVQQLAQGIELKDFSQIMDIFNRQAAIEGCFSPAGDPATILGHEIQIDQIQLGYMPIIWKDHPDQLIFVPVWDFFGKDAIQLDANVPKKQRGDMYAAADKDLKVHEDLGTQTVLTINALDGTIIQRVPGSE